MKIGCISWSHRKEFEEGKLDLFSWMEHCKKDAGLDGVELWNNHFSSIEPAYLERLLEKSKALELPIYSVATKCVFGAFSPEEVEKAKQTLRDWLRVADTLGSGLLRVSIGGQELRDPQRQSTVFTSLRDVVQEGAFPHIKVGIENQEPGVVQNAADVETMREQSEGALCLILDNGSFINKADSYAFMEKTLPVAGVVHAKFFDLNDDGSDRMLEYTRVLEILQNAAYTGYVSIEYDSQEPASRDVPRIAAYLRRLFKAE